MTGGRGFLRSDTAGTTRVAVVNESFARHYWPDGDAVGHRLRLDGRDGPAVEIVGVVPPIKNQTGSRQPDFIYLPLTQHPVARLVLLVRTSGDPLQMVEPVKEIVRALDPNLPMLETRAYEDLYRYAEVDGPGVAIRLVGSMGLVALILATAGLYGLIAYNVSRRTREIGIRMALGATTRDVLRLVMGNGFRLVGTGIGIGLALVVGVERLMNAMVFDAGRVDLVAYALLIPAMLGVTMLAAYVPGRRASKIAPTEALRYE